MSKELLVNVLTKELGIGLGVATDIADACTMEQLNAVAEYLKTVSQSPTKQRIDNWDKYAIMMMTAFKSARCGVLDKSHPYKPSKAKSPQRPNREVGGASLDRIREFLNV